MGNEMRFLSLTLSLLLIGCATVQAEGKDIASSKEFPLDLCNYGYEDYDALKDKFEEMYPKGKDVGTIRAKLGSHVQDWQGGSLQRSYIPDGYEVPNARHIYGYIKTCPLSNENSDKWQIIFITKGESNNSLVFADLILLFKDQNFSERGIPFTFKHNYWSRNVKHILNDIMATGTLREDVISFMKGANFTEHLSGENKETYTYKIEGKDFYGSYMTGSLNTSHRITAIFTFDEQEKLTSIKVR